MLHYFPLWTSWLLLPGTVEIHKVVGLPISGFSNWFSPCSGRLLLVKSCRVERGELESSWPVFREEECTLFLVAGSFFGCGALNMASIEKGNNLLPLSCWLFEFLPFKFAEFGELELFLTPCLSMKNFPLLESERRVGDYPAGRP